MAAMQKYCPAGAQLTVVICVPWSSYFPTSLKPPLRGRAKKRALSPWPF